MIGNPIRDAGLGGFKWRDETILEELKSQTGKLAIPALLHRSAEIATAVLVGVLTWHYAGITYLAIFAVLAIGIKFFKLDATAPQSNTIYGLLLSVLVAIGTHDAMALMTSILLIVVLVSSVSREVLLLSALAVAGASSIPHHGVMLLVMGLIMAISLNYAYRSNHLSLLIEGFLIRGKKRLVEPIRMPIGYYKIGAAALKKALKENNGSISARHKGSIAERRSAMEMMSLPVGSISYHDIPLPGSNDANIDHINITPNGVFVVDSKLFVGKIVQKEDGSIVKTTSKGEQDLGSIVRQMIWIKKEISSVLDTEVRAVVIVHNAEIERTLVAKDDKQGNVAFMSLGEYTSMVRKFPETLDKSTIKSYSSKIAKIADKKKGVYSKKRLK